MQFTVSAYLIRALCEAALRDLKEQDLIIKNRDYEPGFKKKLYDEICNKVNKLGRIKHYAQLLIDFRNSIFKTIGPNDVTYDIILEQEEIELLGKYMKEFIDERQNNNQ